MIITIASQKGGVGKTTLCVNLALECWKQNKSVCLIDLDSQANVSIMFNKVANYYQNNSLFSLLKNEKDINDVIDLNLNEYFWNYKKLKNIKALFGVIYSEQNLNQYDLIKDNKQMNKKFIKLLEILQNKFDNIFIDTPPNLTQLTKLALLVSDKVLIPYKNDLLSVNGIYSILNLINSKEYLLFKDNRQVYIISYMNKTNTKLDLAFKNEIKDNIKDYKNTCLLDVNVNSSSLIANSLSLNGYPISLSLSNSKKIKDINILFRYILQQININ